jgi:hypothetical protein
LLLVNLIKRQYVGSETSFEEVKSFAGRLKSAAKGRGLYRADRVSHTRRARFGELFIEQKTTPAHIAAAPRFLRRSAQDPYLRKVPG